MSRKWLPAVVLTLPVAIFLAAVAGRMPDRARMLEAIRERRGVKTTMDDSFLFPDLPLWVVSENWARGGDVSSIDVDGWALCLVPFDASAPEPHEVILKHLGNRYGADANVFAPRRETYAASLAATPRSWAARLSFALGLHHRSLILSTFLR